jgi:NitT/TauT family transport system ATP-binding protein
MIEIQNISRVYPGGTQALNNVSITVPKGQFVSLLGPSGCGKSTLLSILAGLDQPTSGSTIVRGTPGVVFQEAALFPWLTIRDNIAFGLKMQRLSRSEQVLRADAALKLVHLFRFADAFPHELSGGMRQRAAIARALVINPDLLLMDEPFGALDAQTRALLQAELLRVWDDARKTVIFVTHSLDEALLLSDRILLFSARPGKIVGDYLIDAPRPRNPASNPHLARLRERLSQQLATEVSSVAAAEHDDDWNDPQLAQRHPDEEPPGGGI